MNVEYVFEVEANYLVNPLETPGRQSIRVMALSSEPLTIIDGGSRSVSRATSFVLDGQQSIDFDGGELEYSWKCTDTEGTACTDGTEPLTFLEEPSIQVAAFTLPVGEFTFTLTVRTEASLEDSTTARVSIVPTEPPEVFIAPLGIRKANPASRLVLPLMEKTLDFPN